MDAERWIESLENRLTELRDDNKEQRMVLREFAKEVRGELVRIVERIDTKADAPEVFGEISKLKNTIDTIIIGTEDKPTLMGMNTQIKKMAWQVTQIVAVITAMGVIAWNWIEPKIKFVVGG